MSEFRRRLLMQSKADNPILKDYLTIVALEDGLTAKLSVNACEYCVDGDGVWKTLPAGTETETVNSGQTLSFRGNLTPNSSSGIGTFTINKYHNLKGNCMSMLFGDDGKNKFSLDGYNYAFKLLFFRNSNLIDASEFDLPATTLASYCYDSMFYSCTNITIPPHLPALTLAAFCYLGMFRECKNLIIPPKLPAITLAHFCYNAMFMGCVCLVKSPELFAKLLSPYCYCAMFKGCNKLTDIKMLATETSANKCLDNWVNGVATTGTFVKSKDATWDVVGVNGIPEGWTIITE